jgi:alkylhydroperoxidase/carboxymuconolactone decarboxylase family protein YurZ
VSAAQVRAVLDDDDGLCRREARPRVVLCLSTVSVDEALEFDGLCAAVDVGFVDCGVTTVAAAPGGLVALVGGQEEALRASEPVLSAFAAVTFECGGPGTGMATKLARNVMTYASWAVTRAALEVLSGAGVDPSVIQEVAAAADPDGRMPFALERMRATPDSDDQRAHTAELLRKDLRAARQRVVGGEGVGDEVIGLVLRHAGELLGIDPVAPGPDSSAKERGLYWMDQAYGAGFAAARRDDGTPHADQTLTHLFADVWSRPELSVRDRRLLVMGATAQLGRAELFAIQAAGALDHEDLTPAQLLEIPVQLAPYVGWGNAGSINAAAQGAIESWLGKGQEVNDSPAR